MPLKPGFGIELTMLVQINADWHQVYVYYNHGLEPPYGGVRSEETGEDIEITVDHFDKIMGWTNVWIGFIRGIVKSPLEYNPDLPLDYKIWIQSNGDVVLAMDIAMETLDSYFRWSKDTGLITLRARDAFDLSWETFLFYLKTMEDFSAKIKEQS